MTTLDLPSRILLAVTSAVVAFALAGFALGDQTSSEKGVAVAEEGSSTVVDEASVPSLADMPAVHPPAGATPTPNPLAPPVTIAFGGDVHGEPPIEDVLLAGDNPLDGVADWLSAADIAVVNLETAIGEIGTPADKTYTFRADASLADALADAGVDVVNLANNHGLDYGHDGAEETVRIVTDAGMAAVGYGEDADAAYAPEVIDVGGRTVAVLGLSRVFPVIEWEARSNRPGMASVYDLDRAVAAVRDAATMADHLVVTVHWGRERMTCPDGDHLAMARAFAAAGADVIVGHHPHVLQGVTDLDGTLVAYSVGNFVFYAKKDEQRDTGVLTVTLGEDGVEGYRWLPARIDDDGSPQPLPETADLLPETLTAVPGGDGCAPIG